MNNISKTSANTLVWGDVFRPFNPRGASDTWYRVHNVITVGGMTLITYTIEGSDQPGTTMRVAALSTMEVQN